MSYKDYQARLLNKISKISEKTREAYCKTPRHLFVKRFSVDGERWISLNYENMKSHLPLIYSDHPLLLFDNGAQISTISQPSLVLRMLDLLDVMEGHKVFELGTGSGWNAALLGQLVGKEGLVMSFEIIDEMARTAQENLAHFDLPQVKILTSDGALGYEDEAPYDRGIFTAGANDIPRIFFDQIKEGGKLLFVLHTPSQGDLLLVLRKKSDHFEEEERVRCQFVPVTGSHTEEKNTELDKLVTVGRMKIYPKDELPHLSNQERMIQGPSSNFVF